MSNPAVRTHDEFPDELPELSEPLALAVTPCLAEGTLLEVSDGSSFHVGPLKREEWPLRTYDVTSPDFPDAWLRHAGTAAATKRLRREAEILQTLTSPRLSQFIAYLEREDEGFLVVTSVAGPTLAETLVEGSLSFPQLLSILSQLAVTLQQLHGQGYACLGLRPAVIALSRPVRLLDLSYAVRIGELPEHRCFHAGYTAPEVATGAPAAVSADIYTLGAILYHAVYQRSLPESGPDLAAVSLARPIPGIPQILHRCLGRPEERYASMEQLHQDLLRLARRGVPTDQHLVGGETTIGLEPGRTTNQDAYCFLTGQWRSEDGLETRSVLCVADGMGGMAAGEVASRIAVETIIARAAPTLTAAPMADAAEIVAATKQWVTTANEQVCGALERIGVRGGCTLLCAYLVGRRLFLAHVGDCRAYLFRGDEFQLLTRDHSLAMALVTQGELTLKELRRHPDRNQVSRSLGDRARLPDYFVDTLETATGAVSLDLMPGDVLLIGSDGLWEPVEETEMQTVIHELGADPVCAAHALVGSALRHGAPDNATALLLRLEELAPQWEIHP